MWLAYLPKRVQVRVIPINVKIPQGEWKYYWDDGSPFKPSQYRTLGWMLNVVSATINCAGRPSKSASSERHIGRVSFAMNGVVPPVKEAPGPVSASPVTPSSGANRAAQLRR